MQEWLQPERHLSRGSRSMGGFTLIELMIVVVIIAILATIAYPSYKRQVEKSRRTDGKAALMDTAQRLERCYTRFGRYNDASCSVTLPFNTSEGFYKISAVGSITAAAFTLAAGPQNEQAGDTRCGELRLTSTGLQGSQGATTDTNDCW